MRASIALGFVLSLCALAAAEPRPKPARVAGARAQRKGLALWNALPDRGRLLLGDKDSIGHRRLTERSERPLLTWIAGESAGGDGEVLSLMGTVKPYQGTQRWHLDAVKAAHDRLPWIRSREIPELVRGKGTPPLLLASLAHLRAQGVQYGQLGMLTLDVQSPDAIMDYVRLKRSFIAERGYEPTEGRDKAALLRQTPFIRSLESVLELSGHTVTNANVWTDTTVVNLGDQIHHFAYKPGVNWGLRDFAPGWLAKAGRLWPGWSVDGVWVESRFNLVLYLRPSG